MVYPLSFLQNLVKIHQGGIKDVILKFYQSRHPKILVEKEMSKFNFFFGGGGGYQKKKKKEKPKHVISV